MTRLYILGAGTPTPTAERFGSSMVVQLGDECVMFDCGPATTHKLAKVGLLPTQVSHLFFTHHHFDHNVDYPCFLLSRWDQSIGLEPQLKVYGPVPTTTLTHRLLDEKHGAFAHDWITRVNNEGSKQLYVNRGGTLPRRPPTIGPNGWVSASDVQPGAIANGDGWKVTATTAHHAQPYLDSLAYRLDTSETSIVFNGDTMPCQSITELARNADTMVSMCWDLEDRMIEETRGKGHMCGARSAGRMAAAANVGRLLLVHMGPNIASEPSLTQAREEVSELFEGETIFSEELMTLDL